ncbi:hypothetical protein FHX42_005299 [Saccharopolyspora lacisalsi]|uniref:Uncharacterized protein n=1 Tax=Halosaccharopolyspora lacisalsi TaxID=1000566 RepID=A0A839E123_9PSEU|nr:hypothetical protein [Halosaccharopolyspora lacisalsi]MBA8827892.1 hypothetical protein [Halosaccharopolyspora lacisalsi]
MPDTVYTSADPATPIWWGIHEQPNPADQHRHAYTGDYRNDTPVTALCGLEFQHRKFDQLDTERQYARTCGECERRAWRIRNRSPHPYWDAPPVTA